MCEQSSLPPGDGALNVEDLLAGMARVARDDDAKAQADDPRWLSLTRDELTEEERDQLQVLAAESEETRSVYALLQPMDAATRKYIVDGALATQEDGSLASMTRTQQAARKCRPWWLAMPLLAAAAMLAMVFWRLTAGPLPRYGFGDVWSDGGQLRSSAQMVSTKPLDVQLGRGERFMIMLRPDTSVSGQVKVVAFRVRKGEATRWLAPVDIKDEGTLLISGSADRELAFEPGDWTLVFAVGRADLPSLGTTALQEAAAQRRATVDGWQLLVQELHVQSAQP